MRQDPFRLFLFRLALAFGCTVSELSDRVNSSEIVEWMAYYNIEPWGSPIDGLRHACTASTVANVGLLQVNPKSVRGNRYGIDKFTIGVNVTKRAEELSPDERTEKIRSFFMSIARNTNDNR